MNITITNETEKRAIVNGSADGFMSVSAESVLVAAEHIKESFSSVSRYINVSKDTVQAIDAAYKTGSGIYSEDHGIIAKSIYDLSKVDVALTIVKHDASDSALDRAAFEIARDAFISGKIDERAQDLSEASGKSLDRCKKLINKKLFVMKSKLQEKSGALTQGGEPAPSAEKIKEIIINEPGRYLVQLPTGEGKTSLIAEPVIEDFIKNNKKAVVISHRRSINAGLCEGMDGVISYDKVALPIDLMKNKGLKVVVNSLNRLTFKSFLEDIDLVVVDEASQVISHILSGEVKERDEVWTTFKEVIARAKTVIFTDADINKKCKEIIGKARHFKKVQDHKDISIKTSDTDTVRALITNDATDGKKILIACDVAREARALGKRIEDKTGRKALVITADSANWTEQAEFIRNPNDTEHEIVIYSPVITSALSITSDHFDAHYGLFNGQVTPSDAIQMLRRSRTAKAFTIGLRNPEYRKSLQVDVDFEKDRPETLTGLLKAIKTSDTKQKEAISEVLKIAEKTDAFDNLRYTHCSNEAWLKDNIQNTLPATLQNQGFQVEVMEQDEDLAAVGYADKMQGLKSLKADIASKVLVAKGAKEEIVKKVKDQGANSESEHFDVIKTRARQVLKKTVLTDQDVNFWGEGEGEAKMKRFRKLYESADLSSAEGRVIELISTAISGMLDKKGWSAADSASLIDALKASEYTLIRMGINVGNVSTERAKQGALSRVMTAFGLKTKKVNGSKAGIYYRVSEESFEYMWNITR